MVSVVMVVVEAFVPAVVPRSIPRAGQLSIGTASRRMALPRFAALPGETAMLYRIAALDERGRIAEQSVVHALGWGPGQRLQLGLLSNTAVAVLPDAAGMFTLARRGHIALPVAVRRWCHLQAGDRVLLAAAADRGVLIVYTMRALDAMVTAFDPAMGGGVVS